MLLGISLEVSIRKPRFHRYPQVACTGALVGCLATVSPHALAASSDRHVARGSTQNVSQDDGVVTLTGLLSSSTITRHAARSLASNSRQKGEAGASGERVRAGFLPSTVQVSRARWNTDTPGGVGVDNVSYRMAYGTPSNAVSVGVGAAAYSVQPNAAVTSVVPGLETGLPEGPLLTGTLPSVSVAYRRSFADRYHLNMEATKASSLSSQLQDSLVATKVALEYKPAQNSTIGLEQGSLSLKMNPNGNFAMKIRRGGPMFYLRSRF